MSSFFNDRYFFVTTKKKFADAQSDCNARGGKLFEPLDSRVLKTVINHAESEGIGTFWLGINDKNEEGTFVYDSDNSVVSELLLDWQKGRPDNIVQNPGDPGEDCIVVGSSQLNDKNCDDFLASFVCESKSILNNMQ